MDRFTHLYPWQMMSRAARAPLTCRVMEQVNLDMAVLSAEVATIISTFAPPVHSRRHHHDGGWKAIGLIAHDGDPLEDRLRLPLKKTPALALAPYLESQLDRLEAVKGRVRLMELQPNKSILWHYDRGESIDGGSSARFHIPIATNSRVQAQISHEDLVWNQGEIWYGDFSFPHRMFNGGERSRIHLVIDLMCNDFVLSLFPERFLRARKSRLRAKRVCQRMFEIYEVGRLPPHKRMDRIKRMFGSRVAEKAAAAAPAALPLLDFFGQSSLA